MKIEIVSVILLVTGLCALAPVVAEELEDPPPPELDPELAAEEGRMKSLRAVLVEIHEALLAGAPLSEIPAFKTLDPGKEEDLTFLHQILLKLATPEEQKMALVHVLVSWKRKESVYPLLLTMSDSSERRLVRAEILRKIGEFGDDRAVIPLVDALKAEDRELHHAAARGLAAFGANERAQEQFRLLLVHGRPSTRGWGARALGWSGWDQASTLLLEAEDREKDPWATGEILVALADTGAEEGIEAATTGLAHDEARVRAKACEALGAYGPRARDKALAALLDRVKDVKEVEGVRGTAAWVLASVAHDSEDAAKTLVELLGSESEVLDNSAKTAMQYLASPWLVERLIEILGDARESEKRRTGAWQLLKAMSWEDRPADAGVWRAWWSEKKGTFQFPRAKKAGGGSGNGE